MKTMVLLLAFVGLACNDRTQTTTPPNSPDSGTPDMTPTPDMDLDQPPGTSCAEPKSLEVGSWALNLSAQGVLTINGPDTSLVSHTFCPNEERTGLRMMRGEPKVREAFGNFRIEMEPVSGESQWWSPVAGTVTLEANENGAVLEVPVENLIVRVEFESDLEDGLRLQMVAPEYPGGELAFRCSDAAFFGLGSQVTGMDLRGRTYPLWTQEQGNGKPESGNPFPLANIPEAAYAPMGVWHASTGWSALVTHDAFSELSLCKEDDVLALRSYIELPGMVLLSGTPRERLTKVTAFTGRNDGVPDWVFGFWVSAVGGPWRVDEVASTLRNRGIPASAIWTEDWIGGDSTEFGYRLSYAWEWDQEMYPDLPAQVDSLHENGFAFLAYFNPFVPQTTRMFQEGVDGGYLIKDDDGEVITFSDPAFRTASLVDLTNPAALAWSKGYQERAVNEIGADGWMVDFAEWLPTKARMHDGSSGWQFHNSYPVAWQRANRELLEELRGEAPANWTYFARSGWASANGGTPGVAPTLWAGDQDTTWDYQDGFPTIFPIGAHLGMSGVAIYGSDIAGYSAVGKAPTTKQLFFRWMAAAAFHPLMRTHHGGAECDNWSFDRDEDTLLHSARYARIHGRLLPYFRALMEEATAQGWPIVRHPYLVEGDRPELWSTTEYQYFLGDNLLVAPVMSEGAAAREVLLPEAGWWPLFGAEALAEASITASATVAEVPVFVRPGTALVLMPDVDSFYGASANGVSDLADVDSRLIALYPSADGSATSSGEVEITASGLNTWDTSSLSACEGTLPCLEAGLVLIPSEPGEYTVGDATLTVASVPSGLSNLRFGLALEAWGDLVDATPFSENPESPTWCDRAPD